MSAPDDAWKHRVLEDFRQWLDDLPESAAPPSSDDDEDDETIECDLHALFAELAALRQEIHLRNREQGKASRELAKAAAVYETVAHQVRRREEDLAAFERRVAGAAENRCLLAVLDVRDALVQGRHAAVRLGERRRWFQRPPPGAAGVVEGYELAMRRFDRTLSRFGVQGVRTVGAPFDSRTMHAVEVRRVAQTGNGVVVEELRSGYTREGEVLRPAEVAVNRLDLRGPDGGGFDTRDSNGQGPGEGE